MPPTRPTLPVPFGEFINTTAYYELPGATLYYETYGDGPITILFISGGNGNLEVWRLLAKALATQYNYRVVIYDRRGFSRSHLSASAVQDYSKRLETDATDAKLLLEEMAAKGTRRPEKNIVLGTSSGAIVALKFLDMFPDSIVDKVIVHEPPLLTILPDKDQLIKQQHEVYDMYRSYGVPAAMLLFAQSTGMAPRPRSTSKSTAATTTQDPAPMLFRPDVRDNPYISNNIQYWFERELLQYTLAELDLEGIVRTNGHKMVLANGKETDPDAYMFRTGVLMSERYGARLVKLAGDHMGYQNKSREWAADLDGALKEQLGI